MSSSPQINQLLMRALEQHRRGALGAAEQLYQQVLFLQPNEPETLNLLGVLMHQTSRSEQGSQLIARAVGISPTFSNLNNLGEIFRTQGKINESIPYFQRSIQMNPNSSDAHNNLGLAMTDLGRFEDAEKCFLRATQITPNRGDLFIRLCMTRQKLDDPHGAITAGKRAIELMPENPEAWSNLSLALGMAKKHDEALKAAEHVIKLAPQRTEAHVNLGLVYEKMGRVSEAETAFRKAIELNPNYSLAHRNLAALMDKNDQPEKSIEALVKALTLQPVDFHGWNNLATIRRRVRDFSGALQAVDKALQLQPNHPSAHGCRGLVLLAMGDYERGFEEYEWRWRCDDFTTPPRDFGRPMWDGSDPAGRTILVHAEQGFGDMLQFVRYVPMLADRGAKVLLECAPPLYSLLLSVKGVSKLIPAGVRLGEFDLHVPLMSLPKIFRTTMATVPNEVPYLSVDPQRIDSWKRRFKPIKGLKVGLTWAGNVKPDPNRTCSPEKLSQLAEVGGVTFVSLQKKIEAPESLTPPRDLNLIDVSDDLREFADTAAAMLNLDLILTIDTAAAHLAGALARPTWTLLPWAADWRWLEDRDDSPWYPTMKLFRQATRGDWQPVISRILNEMKKLAEH